VRLLSSTPAVIVRIRSERAAGGAVAGWRPAVGVAPRRGSAVEAVSIARKSRREGSGPAARTW
jgi:hypothetical protein